MPDADDELHHFGWNACSSCAKNKQLRRRTHLVLPALHSSHVYLVNVADNPREPFLEKVSVVTLNDKSLLIVWYLVEC